MRMKSNQLAHLIKKRRSELKISQRSLNSMMGWSNVNGQTICNIERGLQQLPPRMINKLSCAIMVSRDEIMDLMVKDYQEALKMEVLK